MKADLPAELVARAKVHAALGDPARLAIAEALMLGDWSPSELGQRLGMPTNLLAHHVNLLAEAQIVARSRSEHDRRRTYLTLRAETLALAGMASPASPVSRVVFVCTHNSARSQLAAALWAAASTIPAASAGTDPAPRVHAKAIKAARRHGLAMTATGTAHIDDVATSSDLIIAVCDRVHEQLPGLTTRLHWSVPDPAVTGTDTAFDNALQDLRQRIDRVLPALDPSHETAPHLRR